MLDKTAVKREMKVNGKFTFKGKNCGFVDIFSSGHVRFNDPVIYGTRSHRKNHDWNYGGIKDKFRNNNLFFTLLVDPYGYDLFICDASGYDKSQN